MFYIVSLFLPSWNENQMSFSNLHDHKGFLEWLSLRREMGHTTPWFNIRVSFSALFVQIYFPHREAIEEVFVTGLEVDFPEFKTNKGMWETFFKGVMNWEIIYFLDLQFQKYPKLPCVCFVCWKLQLFTSCVLSIAMF